MNSGIGDERSVSLRRLIASRPPHNGAYPTIAVDGRGASGKSSLAEWLANGLPGFAVLHGDAYFEPDDQPIVWGEFNEARFDAEVLAAVRAGRRSIDVRPYDYQRGRVDGPHRVDIVAGVIVERCFSFALDVDWDVRIWVETPRSICLARGIDRDSSPELGERARLAWETVWQPREDEYIRAHRPRESADMVLDGTRPWAC